MKLSKNLVSNSPREAQFIGSSKTSRCRPSQQSALLSVDRSVDRSTVRFLTVGPAVDRGPDTESRALCRSTARSTGAISREQNSLAVDRVGRPALQPNKPCTFCARRSTAWSTDLYLGRPCGRPSQWSVDRRAQNVHALFG